LTLLRRLTGVNAKRRRETNEPTPVRKILAANIRAFREELGISQERLAKLTGIPQKRIWEIEMSAPNLTLDTLTALAGPLNKTEAELLTVPKKPRI
jgi:transcriptional regulator with XRE-family HTH domain